MTIKVKHQLVATTLHLMMLFTLSGCQSDEKQALDYLESAKQYYASEQYSLASVEIKNAIRKDSNLAEPYMLQAKIFEKKKEWEAMHAFLATTLQQQPNHIEANIEIAKLYAKGHNFINAQKHLDTAIKGGVNQHEQHLVQGIIFLNNQRLEQAADQASAALTIDPSSVDAAILSAAVLLRQERFDEALSETNKALALNPEAPPLLLMKSKIFSIQGAFSEAAVYAKTLTALFPKELSYHYLLAALHDRAGEKSSAEQALENATRVNPDNPKAKIALAGYISQQDRTQAAIDLLSLYIDSESKIGNEELRLILAELYQKQGQMSQASDVYKSLIKSGNKFAFTAKNKLALIALKDNRQDEALNILNEVLNSDFSNVEALIARSIVYLDGRRTDEAITDLLSAIREDPESELALMLLSRAYKQNNNNKLAIQTLNKLIRINPTHKEAVIQYSQLLYQEKNYKGAIKSLNDYLDKSEPSSVVHENLMNAYLADRNWNEAKRLAQIIVKTSKQPEYQDYTNAIIFQLTNKFDQSTRILKSLVQKKMFVHQCLKAITYNYRKLNKAQDAQRYITSYVQSTPDDLFAINLLVSEYRRDQQYSQAESTLIKALKSSDDWADGHLQLAKLYAAQAKWDKAISSGLRALSEDKNKNSIDTLLLLASSYDQSNNKTQAVFYYRRALELSPNIQSAANNLALLLAGNGENQEQVDEAFKIAKRFEKSSQPLLIDTLGWIYFLRGNYQQAIILLEKAVFGAPDEAVIHYHLGETLLQLSEQGKAREHLQKSRELAEKHGTFDGYEAAKALLDKLT